MSSRARNLIILIILLLIAAGGAAFYLFFQPQAEPPQQIFERFFGGGRLPTESDLPEIRREEEEQPFSRGGPLGTGLFQITDQETIGPTFADKGAKIRYLLRENGHVFEINATSSRLDPGEISGTTFGGVTAAFWSPVGDAVVVQFFSQSKVRHHLLNLTNPSSSSALPDDITSVTWAPSGKELAFTKFQNNKSTLVVQSSSGKGPSSLYESPLSDLRARWLASGGFALGTPPSGLAEMPLLLLHRSTKALSIFKQPTFGLGYSFSPSGERVVISETNERGEDFKTTVQDKAGRVIYTFPTPTLAEKCLWKDDQSLICLVPAQPLKGTLPDDIFQGVSYQKDSLIGIDLTRLEGKTIWELTFEVKEMVMNASGDGFLFINKEYETLWLLKTK